MDDHFLLTRLVDINVDVNNLLLVHGHMYYEVMVIMDVMITVLLLHERHMSNLLGSVVTQENCYGKMVLVRQRLVLLLHDRHMINLLLVHGHMHFEVVVTMNATMTVLLLHARQQINLLNWVLDDPHLLDDLFLLLRYVGIDVEVTKAVLLLHDRRLNNLFSYPLIPARPPSDIFAYEKNGRHEWETGATAPPY